MADSTIRYPYRTFRYTVEIDGIARGGFSEVSGFDLNVDVVEYREGDDLRNTPRKLPGLTKYGNITFKWGVVGDMMIPEVTMQTTFEFMLPRGYVDENGEVHRSGTMRLATAADEILPLRDPRVQQNGGYLSIILLSRVITKLGTLPAISTKVIENLFTVDIAYLQDLYQRINLADTPVYKAVCPKCGEEIELPLDYLIE